MAIPDHARANFDALLKLAQACDLALVVFNEVDGGESRYVLRAVESDDGDYGMNPLTTTLPATVTMVTSLPTDCTFGLLDLSVQRTSPSSKSLRRVGLWCSCDASDW